LTNGARFWQLGFAEMTDDDSRADRLGQRSERVRKSMEHPRSRGKRDEVGHPWPDWRKHVRKL